MDLIISLDKRADITSRQATDEVKSRLKVKKQAIPVPLILLLQGFSLSVPARLPVWLLFFQILIKPITLL